MNQTKKGLVTVVTVTYNAENFIEQTMKSVLEQSYEKIEYIVIDGASTDKTASLIKQHESHISYWVSEADNGIYYAMNKAIDVASGEYINFLNAGDMFADRDSVREVMANRDDDAELIYGNHVLLDPRRILRPQPQSRWYVDIPFCHQTLFAKTSIYKDNPFDTRFSIAADHAFALEMYETGRIFQYLNQDIAIYIGGGKSQREPFVACVESLSILLRSEATEDEIKKSWWYRLLKSHLSANDKGEVAEYRNALKDLTSISLVKRPLEKLKKYKQLLSIYHSMD